MQSKDPNHSGPAETPALARSRFYKSMALFWLFPTFTSVWIIVMEAGQWLAAGSAARALARVPFESWMALVILLMEPAFAGLALWHRRREERAQQAAPPHSER